MKKILVALALAAFASTTYAAIAGSAHDFQATTYATDVNKSSCAYCHTPHNATTPLAPLWAIPVGTTTDFTSGAFTGGFDGGYLSPRGNISCLSCHSVAQPVNLAQPFQDGNDNLGTELGDDHPIGSLASFVIGTTNWPAAGFVLGTKTYADGATVTMSCTTCHDAHNRATLPYKMVKLTPGADSLCQACHTNR